MERRCYAGSMGDDLVHPAVQSARYSGLHAKLDELLRVDLEARSELARLDEREPEDIENYRDMEVRKTSVALP